MGTYDERPAAATAVSRFRNLVNHRVRASSPGPAVTLHHLAAAASMPTGVVLRAPAARR